MIPSSPIGRFILPRLGLEIPNLIVEEGRISFFKMMWQGNNIDVPVGGNFYIGLSGENGVSPTGNMAGISDELSPINGYARQAFTRDPTGVPTLDVINGQAHIRTAAVTFTAIGGDFSGAYSRFFICNVPSGSAGILYSFSQQIAPPVLISEGQSEDVQYDQYW